jgi:DNA-binding NarL/FixJ family response regulator
VGTVADGSILLETAQRLQPDVIVLDLHLPKVNGLEACRQIIRANPNMKVVIFTGVNDDYVSQAAFAAGASAFVCKLTAGDQLLAAIKRLSADGNRTNRDTL